MDELRLILLGIGVVVIAAVYLSGRKAARQEEREAPLPDPSFEPTTAPAACNEPAVPDWVGVGFSAAPESADLEVLPTLTTREEPGMVVVLTVMSRTGAFTGPAILESAAAQGLDAGSAGVFHYYPDGEAESAWFGVANVLEPGVFDFSAMEALVTPGLVFFLQLPGPSDALALFDRFVATAQGLAERLEGTLCDEERRPLGMLQLGELRERVRSYALLNLEEGG